MRRRAYVLCFTPCLAVWVIVFAYPFLFRFKSHTCDKFQRGVEEILLSFQGDLWKMYRIWAPSSEFVSSSIPSLQILTAHAQPFREARDLAFCLKVSLDSLLVWANSRSSGETARMRRLAWIFAARIGDKYQIRLTRSISSWPTKAQIDILYWLWNRVRPCWGKMIEYGI